MSTSIFPRLREVLAQIDRPGSFCVNGSAPVVLPGLEVKDLGPIGLPLTAGQAKELKQHCEQAPYGKGEMTLVDTHVRRVWHLKPEHFTLANPEWNTFLQQTLDKVQEELGLEKQKLEAHLYDLLLYEKGSFFLPHRDSEKLDRMVATLVIVLPSRFKGGELIVRHEGQEQTIDFTSDDNDPFRVHFAAFYADCEHEIRPLREGYRLCLVYNLTLKKGQKAVSAPRSSEFVQKVVQLLGEWARDDSARRLAVTLDHQYTQDGLTSDALKGADRFKAQVLYQAAQQAGCETALALLTFHECRDAYEEYGYHSRYRRWSDDDEEDEGGSGDYEVGELIDSDLTAAHWSDPHGKRLPIGEIAINKNELVDPDALMDVDPEEEYEGYTGNAGNTLDRWYRHAAIFVWPRRSRFDVLCDGGTESAIESLKPLVEKWQKASGKKAESLREDCIDFARSIIARWRHASHVGFGQQKKACSLMPLLEALDDPGLVNAYLSRVVAKDVLVEPGKSLVKVCRQLGLATFRSELDLVFQNTTVDTLERNVRLLESLCLANPGKNAEGWIDSCRSLAETTIAALETIDRTTKPDWRLARIQRAQVLAGLVRALLATEQSELLSRLLHQVRTQPNTYPLTSAQVPALTELGPWLKTNVKKHSAALSDWIAECRKQLEALTAQRPSAPTDFFRAANVPCACADCRELQRFLEDPNEKEHSFRYGEGRRRHLEEKIRQAHCDLDCKTIRTGSPHTLICTKNTNSYQEDLKAFEQNQKYLATLRSIQASLPK